MTDIATNLATVKQRLTTAATNAGRAADSVRLIAVSKTHDEAAVRAALKAGQRIFGENRVQEATAKFSALRAEYPDLQLHLIGPLQTNKAEDAVQLFNVIQTLDRPRLADALAEAMRKTGKQPALYIQINSGNESQKSGIVSNDLESFLKYCREQGLVISGLMCIPPQNENPEPYFKELKRLADHHKLPHVSMGMSSDYEIAVRCGATEVRVGSAIFGERLKE